MCGINIVSGLLPERTEEVLRAMNARIEHRGPDDGGIFVKGNRGMGHRRLAIIDLSPAGHQPMFSHDKNLVLVFNGEIYNYRELKRELAGKYHFVTETDSEVILALYTLYGKKCLEKLDGMFAFAVYDQAKDEFFIARDRFGKKPLYYYFNNGLFLASSEIRPLVHSGIVPKKIDREALKEYVVYQTVHAPKTIVQGIEMLMPGHYMTVQGGAIFSEPYWSLASINLNDSISENEARKQTRHLLERAVEKRLVADVPFGAFLSGGIDSSAVVALMATQSGMPVDTFNVSFSEKEFDESEYAALVAKKFGTRHHDIRLSPADFLATIPEALKAMDHPGGDGINTYVVSKATKKEGITMALSGLGGDELFAGYDIFKRSLNLQNSAVSKSPLYLRKLMALSLLAAKKGVSAKKMAAILHLPKVDFPYFYPLSRAVFLEKETDAFFSQKGGENAVEKIVSRFPWVYGHGLTTVSQAEISTYMQNVLLRDTDQMSMAVALEIRVPFLDIDLAEFVLSLPDSIKFPHTPKKLLVDSLGDLLPPEIVFRKKMGFVLPWKQWMKNDLRSFCEKALNDLPDYSNAFDRKGLQHLFDRFLNEDSAVTWSRIWHLAALSHWLNLNGFEKE